MGAAHGIGDLLRCGADDNSAAKLIKDIRVYFDWF